VGCAIEISDVDSRLSYFYTRQEQFVRFEVLVNIAVCWDMMSLGGGGVIEQRSRETFIPTFYALKMVATGLVSIKNNA